MSWSKSELRVRLARRETRLSPPVKYWPFQGGSSLVDHLIFFCFVFVMPLCASVNLYLVVTCWERLTSCLSFAVSNCEFVTFPLVSWVRCGTWLYRFLIFAPLLTYQEYQEYLCRLWLHVFIRASRWHFTVLTEVKATFEANVCLPSKLVNFRINGTTEIAKVAFLHNSTALLSLMRNWKLFFCVSLRYEMSGKLHLSMKNEGFHAEIRCNFKDISYLSETQKK